MAEEPELGIRRDDKGIHSLGKLRYEIRDGEVVYMDGGPVRVMVTEQQLGPSSEPTLRDLSEALITVYGTDFGIHSPTWISRFTDMTRQAAAYRAGRGPTRRRLGAQPTGSDMSGRMPYTLLMASSPTKTRRIEIRITEEERDLEQAAAAVSGETLSEFVRRAARHEAERTLAERTRYLLDDEAAQRFLTALEQPSPHSDRGLRRLTEKPSVLPEA